MDKNSKKRILIVIGLLLIVGIVICLFTLRDDKEKNSNKDNDDIELIDRSLFIGQIDLGNEENVEVKDKQKYNISDEIKEEHKYEKYKFTDMKLYTKENKCYIDFTITNIANYDKVVNYGIFIRFVDKEGKIIHFMDYTIPDIAVGESKSEVLEIYFDASNAYDYEFEGF